MLFPFGIDGGGITWPRLALYLPDASRDRAGDAGRLPDLRNGARAEDHLGYDRGRRFGINRHDATPLDRRRVDVAGFHPRDVAFGADCAGVDVRRRVALDPVRAHDAGSSLGRLALFRPGLAFFAQPPS